MFGTTTPRGKKDRPSFLINEPVTRIKIDGKKLNHLEAISYFTRKPAKLRLEQFNFVYLTWKIQVRPLYIIYMLITESYASFIIQFEHKV